MRLRRIEENDNSKIDDAFIDVCKLVQLSHFVFMLIYLYYLGYNNKCI